jgi:hypothetical protein
MRRSSGELPKRLRYVPLLSAGVLVFLGFVILEGLPGMLWYLRPFAWWIEASPSVLGRTGDWLVWTVSFFVSIAPAIVALAWKRARLEPSVIIAFFILPLLSIVLTCWSYYLGAPLLVGSGFLVSYTLVSRSESMLGVERGSAMRLIFSEVFFFLTVISAGGVVSVLLWQTGALFPSILNPSPALMNTWLAILAIDLEVFYLLWPLLMALFFALGFVAITALFRERFESIAVSLSRLLFQEKRRSSNYRHQRAPAESGTEVTACRWFPYLVLAGSAVLAAAINIYYAFIQLNWSSTLSDYAYYWNTLASISNLSDAVAHLQADRGLFIMLLFLLKTLTGLSAEWVVRLTPALAAVLLALSSFLLVREGTCRQWLASFAGLLSVVSAQTAFGMYAGTITNWIAFSIANLLFALLVRSVRLRSTVSWVGSLAVSLILMASYAYLWVVTMAELALVLVASIITSSGPDGREWKDEAGRVGGVLFGSILIPFVLAYLLGVRFQGLNPTYWLALGWGYLSQGATLHTVRSALIALGETFDLAGMGARADLPFMMALSIVGLLDRVSQPRSFSKIVAAATLVPIVATLITPTSDLTWRGLNLIPLYLTGALGTGTVIRIMNGRESPRKSKTRLAFTLAFAAYVFMSQLRYSLTVTGIPFTLPGACC